MSGDWQSHIEGLLDALHVGSQRVDASRWVLRHPARDVTLDATPSGIRLGTPLSDAHWSSPDIVARANRDWGAGVLYRSAPGLVFASNWVLFDRHHARDTRAKHVAAAHLRLLVMARRLDHETHVDDPLPAPTASTAPALQEVADGLASLGLQTSTRDGALVVPIDPGDGGRFIVTFGAPAPGWIAVDAWPTTERERPWTSPADAARENQLNDGLILGAVILVADNMPRFRACLPSNEVVGAGPERLRFLIDHASGATLQIIQHDATAARLN